MVVVARLALCVVAFIGASQAFFPEPLVNEAVDIAFKELEIVSPFQGLIIADQHSQQVGKHGHEHCELCHMRTVHHIMTTVLDHLKEICASTQCQFLQKKCAQAKQYPEVVYGFLLDHVHAHGKAAAYCYGRGVCPQPGGGHCCCGEHCSLESPTGDDFERVVDMMDLASVEKILPLLPRDDNDESKNQTCGQCIKGVGCCVMESVVKMAKEFCERTECSCMKRRCEWAMEHKGLVLGILIHRVRPIEWSCGYCFGKGTCKFPGPHETENDLASIIVRAQTAW